MNYETVIGLEVHAELATESKIFCGCTTKFGGEPNTQCCPVCTGMPGSLPVLNKRVVCLAIAAGIATNCEITRHCRFDRKNYFYPDLPKAYQISQLYMPVCQNGYLEIDTADGKKKIGIKEIHMEEDAGKLIHHDGENCTLIDYNRCGVPLLEIVSHPDFRSAEEVISYLEKLKNILIYAGISDCKMQEGSLRADVNLSVRKKGCLKMGTRTEMKNLNSFKAISRAIEYESGRQIELIEAGKKVRQETRRWDDAKGESSAMRSKEEVHDYRYFPEPDIPPVEISEQWIENIKGNLPELPDAKKKRYVEELGISSYDADILIRSKNIAKLFEETAGYCKSPKDAANWITVELMKILNEDGADPETINIDFEHIGKIIKMVNGGKINRNIGKQALSKVFFEKRDPEAFVRENGLSMLSDREEIEKIVDKVISDNPGPVHDYKNGKEKAVGYLVGQTMKAMKGAADPSEINTILKEKLN